MAFAYLESEFPAAPQTAEYIAFNAGIYRFLVYLGHLRGEKCCEEKIF